MESLERLRVIRDILKESNINCDKRDFLIEELLFFQYEFIEKVNTKLDRIENRVNESKCKFDCIQSNSMELLTGLNESSKNRKKERKYLNNWIQKTSDNLVIADPYFFSYSGPNEVFKTLKQYTDFVIELLPKNVKSIEIFHLPGPNGEVKNKIVGALKTRGISFSFCETTKIHDRVFIRDGDEAILVGTSLGGYGNKLAFVLDLPEDDLNHFKEALVEIRSPKT